MLRRALPRFLAAGLLAVASTLLIPGAAARAEQAPAPAAPRAGQPSAPDPSEALKVERSRLRAELDRVNGEIDALKRTSGVGDDYRLRARLADAEALAKRLMDIDARLGIRAGTAGGAARPLPAPTASPTDGPADLDAKADILADQVRRLRAQADSLAGHAREMKARQELRRRSGELERDPFGPMESSRRRVASSASAAIQGASTNGGASAAKADGQNVPAVGGTSPPVPGSVSVQAPNGSQIVGGAPAPATQSPAPVSSGQDTLAAQLRDLVDAATLNDIRRLESRGAGSSPQALERAATALRARAAALEARSRTMRAEAHAQPAH